MTQHDALHMPMTAMRQLDRRSSMPAQQAYSAARRSTGTLSTGSASMKADSVPVGAVSASALHLCVWLELHAAWRGWRRSTTGLCCLP